MVVAALGLVILTTIVRMFHELLPLALVMCLAVTYLIPSGLLAVNRNIWYRIGACCARRDPIPTRGYGAI